MLSSQGMEGKMDKLGERLIRDREKILDLRTRADQAEVTARKLRREADEIERLSELSRFER